MRWKPLATSVSLAHPAYERSDLAVNLRSVHRSRERVVQAHRFLALPASLSEAKGVLLFG